MMDEMKDGMKKELLIKYLNKIYTSLVFFREEIEHRDCEHYDAKYRMNDINFIEGLSCYLEIARGPCYDLDLDDLHALISTVSDEISDHDLMIQGLLKSSQDIHKRIGNLTLRKGLLREIEEKTSMQIFHATDVKEDK